MLVTGASSGIGAPLHHHSVPFAASGFWSHFPLTTIMVQNTGAATARVLLEAGAAVFVTGRNTAALEKVDGAAGFASADLTQPGESDRVAQEAASTLGGLSSVVNCAGVLQGGIIGTDPKALLDGFDFNFAVNTRAPFAMMLSAIPFLKVNLALHPRSLGHSVFSQGTLTAHYCGCRNVVSALQSLMCRVLMGSSPLLARQRTVGAKPRSTICLGVQLSIWLPTEFE